MYEIAAAALIVGAVLFNFLLALINANATRLGPTEVVIAEAVIVASALAVALLNFRRTMVPWLALLWAMVMIGLSRWLWLTDVDPKAVRDVIIIPTFVCLGLVAGQSALRPTILILQSVIVTIMLFEWILPGTFSSIVGVKQYYINTRGFSEDAFWNTGSNLFVSATRPGERYLLPMLGLHRLSSVFLEPVSLGNYCICVTAYVCAAYRSLSRRFLLFLVISNGVLLIGCDGRLALATSVLIVVVSLVLTRAPKNTSLAYLPAALALSFVLYFGMDAPAGQDNFAGRIALTARVLSGYDLATLLGANDPVSSAADSGIAYLIATQSVFGVLLIWMVVVLASSERTISQVRYKHALCLYLALTMIVSYSFLTIKTAGLFWFVHGAFQARSDGGAVRLRRFAMLPITRSQSGEA